MTDLATAAALAALRYWASQAGAGEAVWDPPEQHEAVRNAAWLAMGEPAAGDGWPTIDLSQPLQSIFSRIKPNVEGQPAPDIYIRRASLAMSEQALFPTDRAQVSAESAPDPIAALKQAVADLTRRNLPAHLHLEGLLYALQRHAWCLPSPLDAVSLYDFARTHAAVAAARAMHGGDLFLLGGDLSGVQSFLYTLTAAGATKQLRGRSFYLQLLTEACAQYLLRAAGLPLTNLLYAGGGRFYALLPEQIAGAPADTWLATQRATLDALFLHQHQGDLYFAFGGDLLCEADLLNDQQFREAWGKATEAINTAKRRRFADLGAVLFAPQGHGGDEDAACVICGYQGDPQDFAPPEEGQQVRRCKLCDSFEDLGRLLHNAEYLLLHHLEHPAPQPHGRRRRWNEFLNELGIHVQFSGRHARLGERGNHAPSWPVRWTTALALEDRAPPLSLAEPIVFGFKPMANTTPTMREADMRDWKPEEEDEPKPREGDVKPFSVMVAQSRGVKRLGVLRLDVDDLGDLFRYRLDSGLARVLALSAALALFFEGWVGHVCDQVNEPRDDSDQRGSVYTIYSGGDDLFIVGSWHLLPGLARRISDDLATYTGQHPSVHVSAGISLHGAKFPLYQAAEAADEELKRAKSRKDKAALGWLDQVVAWTYISALTQMKETLISAIASTVVKRQTPIEDDTPDREEPAPGASRALLQICQQLYVQYLDTLRKGRIFYGPWLWRGAYQLTRVELSLRSTSARSIVSEIRARLLEDAGAPPNEGARFIERLGLAARWAQLELRKEQTNGISERRGPEEDH